MSWPASVPFVRWLGLLSVATFVVSLVLIPWLIARLPEDYFVWHRQKVEERRRQHPALTIFVLFVKNCLGMVLLMAGLTMLVLPGQGILTMVLGLSLMDFPGKKRLVVWWLGNKRVRDSLNWIRRKTGRPEFVFSTREKDRLPR
ncbi:PGPGW domain-containing protein [Desulfolithobacter sp.]